MGLILLLQMMAKYMCVIVELIFSVEIWVSDRVSMLVKSIGFHSLAQNLSLSFDSQI